ncbi:MAG: DNA adenine methylase [Pyrinomonadaceae bacterium]
MIKSPLRYPGGKSRVAEKIASLVPPFEEYREPFVGGGSVFFALKQKFPAKKFWINDIYTELANFWRQNQTNSKKVLQQISEWKAEFQDGKKLFYYLRENKKSFDEIKQAAAFFVFNRVTFSGTTEAGGFSVQAFEKRFTASSIERLSKISPVLNSVKITNFDYQEVINADGKNVFLFLDPPYFSATKSALYGKNGSLHKSFDHERFAEVLKNCPHRWFLTYDNSPFIRELFSFANITNWDLTYGMRNVTKSSNQSENELIISNYDLSETEQITFSFA